MLNLTDNEQSPKQQIYTVFHQTNTNGLYSRTEDMLINNMKG